MLRAVIGKQALYVAYAAAKAHIGKQNNDLHDALGEISQHEILRQRLYEADYQRREEDEQKQRQRDAEDDRRADDNLRRLLGLEVLFYPLVELVWLLILNGHKLRRVGQRLHTLYHGVDKGHAAADERPAEYRVFVL